MRLFELLASDFWGKHPEKLIHELDNDVLNGFMSLMSKTMENTCNDMRDGRNARNLVSRATISGREVLCRMEVSSHQGTVVFVFRSERPKKDKMGAFYAYCLCAVQDSFDGFSSCVMGNDMNDFLCDVALKPSSASAVLAHLSTQTRKSWHENS